MHLFHVECVCVPCICDKQIKWRQTVGRDKCGFESELDESRAGSRRTREADENCSSRLETRMIDTFFSLVSTSIAISFTTIFHTPTSVFQDGTSTTPNETGALQAFRKKKGKLLLNYVYNDFTCYKLTGRFVQYRG